MAERSFKSEVAKLRLGAGEEFRGEGILAVTKALLQSGVSYVSGYQGAPISHLVDVLADADDVLRDLGIRFEASANEAAAAAALAASINYPLRGAATFKSTVGTNVASDALANLASSGVTGGALIIVGEDYGEGSSIMQERSHAFAMKSQIWLLDPRPNLPSIVRAVEQGFELSEASSTPVMLQLRIRACHVYGRFTAKDNQQGKISRNHPLEKPEFSLMRLPQPGFTVAQERRKLEKRLPAAINFVRDNKLTQAEWTAAIDALTRATAFTDDKRNEYILFSDLLGVSSLVDMVNAATSGTPSSVLGPFHIEGAPELPTGGDLWHGQVGEPLVVSGTIKDDKGAPAKGTVLALWQNAGNGLYSQQDKAVSATNYHARLTVADDGSFAFSTVRPVSYTVPDDGPAGDMLRALGREAWRPAHLHMIQLFDPAQKDFQFRRIQRHAVLRCLTADIDLNQYRQNLARSQSSTIQPLGQR